MKKLLLVFLPALLSGGAFAQWTNQNVPFGFEGYINDIEVVDSNVVWGNPWNATATSPYTQAFVRTVNSGAVWTAGSITGAPASHNISNIWPIDDNTCYVAMWVTNLAGGAVYKTTDGGNTWNQVGSNMFSYGTSFANIVYFFDAAHGIAGGDPVGSPLKYELYTTSDSGSTWTQVPGASLPALANNNEYGITNLFSAVQGHFWFGTTYGDIYHTADMGVTWTKSATGFPAYTTTNGRQDISDIAFSDSLNGLAVQVTMSSYELRKTTDGGMTWTVVTPTGTFYPQEIEGVPGTSSYVSGGSNATFGFGTSYSNDYGMTWNDLDMGVSHTSLDFVNPTTGWGGEYILASSPGGAWKFTGALASITCGSPLVNAGVTTGSDTLVCFGDSVQFSTAGALAPSSGAVHGWALIVSTADISGNNDPLNDPSVVGGSQVYVGTSPTIQIKNDSAVFFPGIYYLTPCVFGNATGAGVPLWITACVLDPTCTVTGNSFMANLLVPGDPYCATGISETAAADAGMHAWFDEAGNIRIEMNSTRSETAGIALYDLTGRLISRKDAYLSVGANSLKLAVPDINKGVYLIEVQGETRTTRKIARF